MKRLKISKKLIVLSMLAVGVNLTAQAQMVDLMGSMGLQGLQTIEATKSVGQATGKLKNTQIIQQMQMKIADITMTYFGEYKNMPIQKMSVGGVSVTFKSAGQGNYYEAVVSPVSAGLCVDLLGRPFENLHQVKMGQKVYERAQLSVATKSCSSVRQMTLILK